jgi:hypothetical protein
VLKSTHAENIINSHFLSSLINGRRSGSSWRVISVRNDVISIVLGKEEMAVRLFGTNSLKEGAI